MSIYCGRIKLSIFGQSHSQYVGMTIEGLPSDFEPDLEALSAFMARRAPGRNRYSTSRFEEDVPEFISGLQDGKLCGAPLTAIIRNNDVRTESYEEIRLTPRPGHADYTAYEKYGPSGYCTGGGQFSGRLAAPLCAAGGLCLQLLEKEGISVISRIAEIGGIRDEGELNASVTGKDFPTVSDSCGEKMKEAIVKAAAEGDSLGGIIECAVMGVPAGLGGPLFDGAEGKISQLVFAVPAVKGIEFGAGFASAGMLGSENNDQFETVNGSVSTRTNNCGGILGGITNGMPLVFRAAVKPTPSISKEQDTVDLAANENVKIAVKGRHDPCIVPRAVPCIEAAAAIAVYDMLLERSAERII